MKVEFEYLDADGYPTVEALDIVRDWKDYNNVKGWFDFIKSIWWYPEWGWTEEDNIYHISTGGWSGNESIIEAMQNNYILWSYTWEEHKRGGHFKFRIPVK